MVDEDGVLGGAFLSLGPTRNAFSRFIGTIMTQSSASYYCISCPGWDSSSFPFLPILEYLNTD